MNAHTYDITHLWTQPNGSLVGTRETNDNDDRGVPGPVETWPVEFKSRLALRQTYQQPSPWVGIGGCRVEIYVDGEHWDGSVIGPSVTEREKTAQSHIGPVTPGGNTVTLDADRWARMVESHQRLLAALKQAERMIDEALPKFNWGDSFLDADAITLLNEAPIAVKAAIREAYAPDAEAG